MGLVTLKNRKDYLRVRGGVRWSNPAFLMEGKRRPTSADGEACARFGFTVTKKMGNAVRRNRMRRRLKAAISEVALGAADPTYDYVVVARSAAFDRDFKQLRADFKAAFRRIKKGPRPQKRQTGQN
ncbi:MAG: ribonuclease P protein component [Hyphomicrobiaceae bacterium]